MNPRHYQTEDDSSVKAFRQSIGTTTSPATNVTVNTSNTVLYADNSFASTNQPIANANGNTFTAIAKDSYGRKATNSVTLFIPVHDWCYYDLNGNLTNEWSAAGGSVRQFAYDDENQLISVYVTNAWRNDFVYDGKMRRRIVKEFAWNAGTSGWQQTNEVHFIYDGNLVVQERDTNNVPQVTYTRGTDLSGSMQGAGGIGGLLARTDNSSQAYTPWYVILGGRRPSAGYVGSAYYHSDGNGNVTCLIYPNQTIAAKYLYDPYGNMLSKYGSLADANTYRFSSKEWNQNSGLYYYLYRLYDPTVQRWLNRDPISEIGFFKTVRPGFEILHPIAKDYRFVLNSPINLIDAFGLWQVCVRPVIWNPNEDNWAEYWAFKLLNHADLRDDPGDPGSTCYPVEKDPNNPNSCKDTKQCLKENPYDSGNGTCGNNCQANTLARLKACGLKAPGWHPDPYAYPPPVILPPIIGI